MSTVDKLLILDLVATLICTTESPLSREPDFSSVGYAVYRRSGVEVFLADCL